MSRHLAICLAIASSVFIAPRPAAATTVTHVFNAVHAIEASGPQHMSVTGVLAGQSTPTTTMFVLFDSEHAHRCERLALVAMTNPGKYQFRITDGVYDSGACKLILLTP